MLQVFKDVFANLKAIVAMTRTFALAFIFALLIGGGTCRDFSEKYRFSAAIAGENYILHWNTNLQRKELAIAVNVSTTGWIGFGFSPNGQMPGSDMIIAWLADSGEVFFNVNSL